MRLVIRKSDWLDDWYVIERAEHDGREWFERIGPGMEVLRASARFSDACVEGSASEMIAIAEAIRKRGRTSFKRCAVRVDGEQVYFCSPRNSQEDGECTLAEADELAAMIDRELPPPEANSRPERA